MNNFRDKIRGLTGLHTALEGLLTTINQIPVSGGGSVDYSTDEKVIGTWIDGKPLYRKVFVVSDVKIRSDVIPGTNIPDIKDIVTLNTVSWLSTSAIANNWLLPSNPNNTYIVVQYNVNQGVFLRAYADLTKISIIVEYTKTTD